MTAALDDLQINMQQCWRCSQCKWIPSLTEQRFNKICPSMEWGGFHSYSGGGKVQTAYALRQGAVPYTNKMLETVFACTMCGACDVGCKSNNAELVEPLDILYALRARIAADGKSLPAHIAMIESLRTKGNPFGKPATDRHRWSDGLRLKDAKREPVDVLLHIGCEDAYSVEYWPELRAIVTLLNRARVKFGIHRDERATGELAFDLGFQGDARSQAQAMASLFESSEAKTIVTCSAASYAAFRNVWPRLGVTLKRPSPLHITEFVEKLFEEGTLNTSSSLQATVTYHDSCKLGRLSETYVDTHSKWTTVLNNWVIHEPPKPILFGNNGLYDAPRKLLSRISGVSITEMPRNRGAAWCCGGAGGAREAFPAFSEFAAKQRLEEARSTGASTLVTASCACHRQLERAGRGAADAADRKDPVQVMGLFDMLAKVTQPEATTVPAA